MGILAQFNANHLYGAACYRPGGCADIIAAVAQRIDARQFNPSYPQPFPRFVQHAIWRYCSQSGLEICNGNRIYGAKRCVKTLRQEHVPITPSLALPVIAQLRACPRGAR